ncbi:type II toxin-antitoxin system VapC family toxin [Rhizobium sp. BG4]|uniref:type II toxin-antitoxin system VapC family toxin n=1 Tax=Rhizobium sp. BG4 TaxID=2613770 RepID=UPI00193D7DFF|nr:type II toxin-antitoxin system VapC family toxin [Rhizobium sp. BG4]
MSKSLLLMDTDIVSFMGNPNAPAGLRPWLLEVGVQRLALCYPVIAELMRGANLKVRDNPARAIAIANWAKELIATSFHFPEMTADVAMKYAEMTATPSLKHMWTVHSGQKSNRLGHDLSIAAVSIIHRIPIMSANVHDYLVIDQLFPIPGLYHPLEARWYINPPFPVSLPQFDPYASEADQVSLPSLRRRQATEGSAPLPVC